MKMAFQGESIGAKLNRIRKQNAEIRLRHLEVEADRKMAERSKALVHNHVTTNVQDMMPAERDAILNKTEPSYIPPTMKSKLEDPVIDKNKGRSNPRPWRNERKARSDQKVENFQRVFGHQTKTAYSRTSFDSDDDEGDLFQNVEDLEASEIVPEDDNKPDHVAFAEATGYFENACLESAVPEGSARVPECQQSLEDEVPLKFLPNMDFSVPPPPYRKGVNVHPSSAPSYEGISTAHMRNELNYCSSLPVGACDSLPDMYVPYSELNNPNVMHPGSASAQSPLPSEEAQTPYPYSSMANRSSPPCGHLPPRIGSNQQNHFTSEYMTAQQDYMESIDTLSSSESKYFINCGRSDEHNEIQLLEKAFHAIGGKAQSSFPPQNNYSGGLNYNLATTPKDNYHMRHGPQNTVLNVDGVEISSELLKKALAIANSEINKDSNAASKSDENGMKVLQLILQSTNQEVNNGEQPAPCVHPPANGRPLLGRGASDQNVPGKKQSELPSQEFRATCPKINEDASKGYHLLKLFRNECGSRPILGRSSLPQENKQSYGAHNLSDNHQSKSKGNNIKRKNSASEKKSGLLARMEAARNDNSHKYSRSLVISEQNMGDVQISYQGKVVQSSQQRPDAFPFAYTDVREKDKLQADRNNSTENSQDQENLVKALVTKKSQLEQAIKSTKESNFQMEEKLKSLSLQKVSPH